MEFLIRAFQLILSLSILVLIHEMGHFMFARIFGTRVEKFYLFFNPWFSLFKKKSGDTEYGLGWLPLGGYVKISGMIDESMDRSQMEQPAQPWEFRSKPAYQRFLIMIGGVLFNFVLALTIYSMILFVWGEQYFPVRNATYGVYCDSLALDMGMKHGDKILLVGDKEPETFADIVMEVVVDNAKTIRVERAGKQIDLNIPATLSQQMIANNQVSFVVPFIPFVVDSIIAGKPAESAGLQRGDQVVGIDSLATPAYYDFAKAIKLYKSQSVYLHYVRRGFPDSTLVHIDSAGLIGVGVRGIDKLLKVEKRTYGIFESIPAGIMLGVNTLSTYVKQMKLIATPEGAKQVGGFGSIGGMFPPLWDWEIFWNMTALLSVILAFMNILPIPALDGGHLAFLLYEMVTGRKPSVRVLEVAQMIGMALLFALLIYANGNDLIRVMAK